MRIRRDALLAVGGFDETLQCAEDYELWMRLALTHDLYITPLDAGVYRTRDGSLTRSGKPRYWNEDRMLLKMAGDARFRAYRSDIRRRLRSVYDTYCYHYRAQGDFGNARQYARKLLRIMPLKTGAWRQVVAGMLRAG